MIKIGITGGIGSGKSVVARLFALHGIPVYIADTQAKLLMNTSDEIKKALIGMFGTSIYTSSDGLDRKKMASLIFTDKRLLQKVNEVIHPVVIKDFLRWAEGQKTKICLMESAILFESGMDKLMERTVLVSASMEERIQRAMLRDQSDRKAITDRLQNQQPDEEKAKLVHHVILNDNSRSLIAQVEELLQKLNS